LSAASLLSRLLARTPIAYWPVRVRRGPARGARWTLLPFSANWRTGGEGDLAAGLACLGRVEGAVCWDFGAHFGIHTVGLAMQVGPEGQVVAFEPDPVAFARLERHVRMNELSQVRLRNEAASEKTGTGALIARHGLGSSFSHFQYEDEAPPAAGAAISVATVVPDDLVAAGEIRPPDLIKVDVQGHGAKALRGSIRSIRARMPIIVFSSHSRWELEETRDLLEPLGYGISTLKGAPAGWDHLAQESAIIRPFERQRGGRADSDERA